VKLSGPDRVALGVVTALLLVAVMPLLGRGVTSRLHLDPYPRDHARCFPVGDHEELYATSLGGTDLIFHSHAPGTRSQFERRGTAYGLAAASAFALLWLFVRFWERVAVNTPPGRLVPVGFGLGVLLAVPPANLASWIARQALVGAEPPPWLEGAVTPPTAVLITVHGLGAAAGIAFLLGARHRRADPT
jgi:hypothetical protein